MRNVILAHLGLLFVAFIWGTTFVVVQHAVSLVEPFTFNAVRFLLAGIILLLIQLILPKQQNTFSLRTNIGPGIVIGIFLFGGYLFQTFGLLYTTSSKAGFLTGLSIVMVPIFSFIFLRQKTGLFAVLGAITATIGLFLLTAENSFTLNKGDILVLCCAVSFALHILVNGKYSQQYSALFLSTIQILAVGVFSLISAILFEDWKVALSSSLWTNESFLFSLMLTALLATALAFFVQTAAQKYTPPTRVAVILAMEPVFAALTGVIVANERLTATAIAGCAFILFGMIFAELPSKPKEKAQAT
ncbi:MAG: DMT family transporter [Ectobacillus sp.]